MSFYPHQAQGGRGGPRSYKKIQILLKFFFREFK
jgi:hypothetical protein